MVEKVKKNGRKLRNFLINNEVQIRVISHGVLYMIAAVAFTTTLLLHRQIRDLLFLPGAATDSAERFLSAQIFLTVTEYLVPGILLLTFLYILHLLVLTHRLCGPVVNFTKTFRALAQGDLTARVRLRRKDYLKPESQVFNEMAEGIAGRIETAKRIDSQIIGKLDQALWEMERGGDAAKIRENLAEVRSLAQENSRVLGNFQC